MSPLAIAETCEILRVSRWTLGRLIGDGEIAARKQDPRVQSSPVDIDAGSLREFIRSHTIPPTSTTEDPLMDSDGHPRHFKTLEEVAAETGFALRTLKLLCRQKKVTHFRPGKYPLMSDEHIAELIQRFTVSGQPADVSDPEVDADRARVARMAAAASTH